MTPRMHLSPAARTAGAALLTTVLIASPVVAPAAAHSPGPPAHPTSAQAAQVTASAQLGGTSQDDGDQGLGDGDPGDQAQLGSSQEGTWFLGRSVDSVLGPGQWYTAEQGRTWYGAYRTFPDEFAYCVDAGLKTPHPRHFDDGEEGEAIDSARSAWALDQHSESDSPDVQAALSALVRLDDGIPHRHQIPPGHPADLGADFADAAEQLATIEEDAARLAGPYTLSVDIRVRTFRALDGQHGPPLAGALPDSASTNSTSTEDGSTDSTMADGSQPTDSVSHGESLTAAFPLEAVVSLTSASGEAVPDQRVRLSATGARTAVDSIVSSEEPTVVSLTDLDEGRLTVDASATDLPATSVELHRPRGLGSDRVQAVVTAGAPTKATAQAVYDRPQVPEETEEPEQPEETDPPRVEVPMPRPTTLPSPSPTPSESPEAPPTPEAPDTPEVTEPPETTDPPETPEPPETTEPPEVTEASEPPPETTPEATGPPESSAPPVESAPPPPPTPAQPHEAPRDSSEDEPVPTSLPRTGAESVMALGLAIVLISVGVAALAFTRRG